MDRDGGSHFGALWTRHYVDFFFREVSPLLSRILSSMVLSCEFLS